MARSAVKTKKGFRDRGRFRRRLRELRQQRELALRDLGGLIFELHRFKQSRQDLVDKKLETLNEIDQELQGLENTLQAFRIVEELHEPGVSSCPSCGALHGTSANFCPTCGLSLKGARAIDSVQHGSVMTPQQVAKPEKSPEPSQTQALSKKDSDTVSPGQLDPIAQSTSPLTASQPFTSIEATRSEEYAVPKLTPMETPETQQSLSSEKGKPPLEQEPARLTQKPVTEAVANQHQQSQEAQPKAETDPKTAEFVEIHYSPHEKSTSSFQPVSEQVIDHHKDEVPTVSSGDPLAG